MQTLPVQGGNVTGEARIKIPVVIGRNRLRGKREGAMVLDDFGNDNLNRMKRALRDAAITTGVDSTPDWLATSVVQMLKMYEDALAAWQANKEGTIGHVFEARLPSGATLLLGDKNVLALVR